MLRYAQLDMLRCAQLDMLRYAQLDMLAVRARICDTKGANFSVTKILPRE